MSPTFQAAKEIWEQEEFKREKQREIDRKSYAKRKKEGRMKHRSESIKAFKAEYYRLNKKKYQNYNKEHYLENKEERIEKAARWQKENPERAIELKKKQKASIAGSKHKLKRKLGFEPPQELVEAYHATLVFRRARLAKKKQLALAS